MGKKIEVMDKRIAILNLVLYGGTIFFYLLGRKDPSSSLGYAFYIVFLWLLLSVLLIVLMFKRAIPSKKIIDRIGIFTATPVLLLIGSFFFPRAEHSSTERQFVKDDQQYKVKTYYFRNSSKVARIEYYRSVDPLGSERNPVWIRDSIWIVFSESGDTVKTMRYR